MPNKNTPPAEFIAIARLLAELDEVTEHYSFHGCGDGTAIVTAWVTPDHVGPDVTLDSGDTNAKIGSPHMLDHRLPLAAALDDVLGKIALSAPWQVPA